MADYFAILKKAILAQDVDSGETRRQVYEKARSALLSQLKAVSPPLPPSDIARQRLGLEEAIRTIERQIADGVFDTSAERPTPAPARQPSAAPARQNLDAPPPRRHPPAAAVVKNAVRQAAAHAPMVEDEYTEELPAEGTASAERGRARSAQRLKTAARGSRSQSRGGAKADPVSTVLNQSFSSEFDTQLNVNEDDTDIVPNLEQFRPELVPDSGSEFEMDSDFIDDPFGPDGEEEFVLPVADPRLVRPAPEPAQDTPPVSDLPPSASLSPALQELRAERQREVRQPLVPRPVDDEPYSDEENDLAGEDRATPFNSFDPVNNWEDDPEPPAEPLVLDDEPAFPPDDDEPPTPYRFEADSKPIVRTRFIEETQTRRPMLRGIIQRNRTIISLGAIGVVLIVVIGLVVGVVFDGTEPTGEAPAVAETPSPASTPSETPEQVVQPRIVRTVDPNAAGKISDRLVASPEGNTITQAPAPAPTDTPSNTNPEPVTAPLNTEQLAGTPTALTVEGGSEKAILYEAPTEGGASGDAYQATVAWSLDTSGPDATIIGQVEVPEKGLFMNVSIKENNDDTLPASHLIEVRFRSDDSFGGKNIDTTPGIFMKNTEQERGLPLIGASAKVSDNYFWIALSNNAVDQKRNEALMLERAWFDIPVQYGTGRQAIVTVAKGSAGQQIFATAIAEWQKQ